MLIYNKKLAVSPLTTHMPISKVSKNIKKKDIIIKIKKIDSFYRKYLKKRPKFAITGLNPHCESFEKENKEKSYYRIDNYIIKSQIFFKFFSSKKTYSS